MGRGGVGWGGVLEEEYYWLFSGVWVMGVVWVYGRILRC